MEQLSLDFLELEAAAAHALQTLSEVRETQLSTEGTMRALSSVDSEVTNRKILESDEVLPTRLGVARC